MIPPDPDLPVLSTSDLDRTRLQALTAEGLLAMDDGELFLELRHEEHLMLEDGRLKVAEQNWSGGFGFRGVAGERVGFACGDRLEEPAIRAAVGTVQAVRGGHAGRENVAPAMPPPGSMAARTRSAASSGRASSQSWNASRPIAAGRSRRW